MNLVFMMVLTCSTALMDDCVAWPEKSWKGENAFYECQDHIPVFTAQHRATTPHNRVYCTAD